jgi:hypothetical protein
MFAVLYADNQGFSVIRLMPYEFATDSTCSALDPQKMKALQDLIQHGAGRWRFKLFDEAKHLLTDTAPTSAPTGVKREGTSDVSVKASVCLC